MTWIAYYCKPCGLVYTRVHGDMAAHMGHDVKKFGVCVSCRTCEPVSLWKTFRHRHIRHNIKCEYIKNQIKKLVLKNLTPQDIPVSPCERAHLAPLFIPTERFPDQAPAPPSPSKGNKRFQIVDKQQTRLKSG